MDFENIFARISHSKRDFNGFPDSSVFLGQDFGQPRPQGSLLPVPTERERERERDPGWVWSRGSSANLLIPREEPFVSQFFCLVRFHRSHNDRKSKIDLLSLQL